MLWAVTYYQQSDEKEHTRMVKAGNRVQAVSGFMDEFFALNPTDALKLRGITEIEMTGDLSFAEEIEKDALVSPYTE